MKNKNSKLKFLIVSMGPGETSHGVSFAQYALNQGHLIDYVLLRSDNKHFLSKFKRKYQVIHSGSKLKSLIEKNDYDVVVLCNSKMFSNNLEFQTNPPKNKPLVVSIDSNWLFGIPKTFPLVQWIDIFFLNLPIKVFENGLKENRGNYSIPKNILAKIQTVGLIPSYAPLNLKDRNSIRQKLGLKANQKLIFSYIGSGVTLVYDFYNQYLQVMDKIYQRYNDKVKVILLSSRQPKKPWIIPIKSKVNSKKFYELLASSDLVFQHQGLATLEQSIAAQVPNIANVRNFRKNRNNIHTWAWEVEPFEKLGLCRMHYYKDPVKEVADTISHLLFNKEGEKMINIQKKYYARGEEIMLNFIIKKLQKDEKSNS